MRVKTGTVRRAKHKKILKANKGYRLTYSKTYRRAHEAFMHAGQYAYRGRKERKRQFRQLWIMRINAALRELGFTYKEFIHQTRLSNVELDRKILADLAISEPTVFKSVVEAVMK
jgi:large subunit ribosomal protein L20